MNQKNFYIALIKLDQPQIWVAQELDIDPATVSRWVRGWQPVPKKYQSKLAEILEVRLEDLFSSNTENL